jgi:hypothetical protein
MQGCCKIRKSGIPRGGSPLAGRAGYPGAPTFYFLLGGGWGKKNLATALGKNVLFFEIGG